MGCSLTLFKEGRNLASATTALSIFLELLEEEPLPALPWLGFLI